MCVNVSGTHFPTDWSHCGTLHLEMNQHCLAFRLSSLLQKDEAWKTCGPKQKIWTLSAIMEPKINLIQTTPTNTYRISRFVGQLQKQKSPYHNTFFFELLCITQHCLLHESSCGSFDHHGLQMCINSKNTSKAGAPTQPHSFTSYRDDGG